MDEALRSLEEFTADAIAALQAGGPWPAPWRGSAGGQATAPRAYTHVLVDEAGYRALKVRKFLAFWISNTSWF